ncbi:MAG: rhodanese-like domain-containing protein [Rhodospirillales bacterium]|nr:rhodanese-like domain-containing protein [Rhodospirillales bacterium]MCW9003051.1 rhodanese-like domain-containing protein [Rhodospirillales bacterium]MCW9039626.1 rhodanese-like domain-containing protein [Rhodospirillales bacterium]
MFAIRFAAATIALFLGVGGWAHAKTQPLTYVSSIEAAGNGAIVIDARSGSTCAEQSLTDARCLPSSDFLGPHGRLASSADIAWVLGSAGLSGAETVLVIGDNPTERDFVAGLLYLFGQSRVSVLARGIGTIDAPRGPGQTRANIRTAVWQAPVRSTAFVFKNELRELLTTTPAPLLLDGRAENAYWGNTVDGVRSGHLPGADHLPASILRSDVARGAALGPVGRTAIVYASHAIDGIAFMTLVIAGTGTPVRVYPGGWAEWAADGTLPIDAASYPSTSLAKPSITHTLDTSPLLTIAAAVGLGAILGVVAMIMIGAVRRGKVV